MCKLTVTWASAVERARIETNIEVPAYVRVALPYNVPIFGHQVKMNGVLNWAIIGTEDDHWRDLQEYIYVKDHTLTELAMLVTKLYIERAKDSQIELELFSQLQPRNRHDGVGFTLTKMWKDKLIQSLRIAIAPVRALPDEDFHAKVVKFSVKDGVVYLAWGCGDAK